MSNHTRPADPEVDADALVLAMREAGRDGVRDESFQQKLKAFATRLGREAAERVVALYYCMLDPDTPARAKATIVGAVAYFVLPLDLIPDALLGIGFTDDVAAIGLAFAA